jgi:hypothetical protein
VLDRLRLETHDLVEAHWPAIERVAAALQEQPFLLQDELDALILDRS